MAEKRPFPWPLVLLPTLGIGLLALSGGRRLGGEVAIVQEQAAPSSSASAAVPAAPASSSVPTSPPPGPQVVDVSPTGERRSLSPRIRILFDRDVPLGDRPGLVAATSIDPHVAFTTEWPEDDVLEVLPERLHPATKYRVVVPGHDPAAWSFRTQFPKPGRVTPGEGGHVVLSFDDGAHHRGEALRLYETLDQLGVKALLFPSGKWAKANVDLLERMTRNGHMVCNHTTNHLLLVNLTDAEIEQEIVGGAGHGTCNLMRPPMMAMSPRVEAVAQRLGYKTFLWDVDTRDWEGLPAEDIVNLVLTRVFPGAVVLMHHHGAHTQEAVPKLVAELRANGYVVSLPLKDGALDLSKLGPGAFRTSAEIK